MNAATNIHQLIPTLPCDAAIPDLRIGGFEPLAPLAEVFAGWRAQITSESLFDMALDFRVLSMRTEDGALVRTNGKAALAYTRHGSGQLLALLLSEKPANLNNVLRWIKPAQRAPVFNVDVRDRSKRNPEDQIVVRTVALAIPGQPNRIRAIRAVVSTRHALKHLDDLALSHALEAELGAGVEATVTRSVDVTHGYAAVGEPLPALRRTIHWRNSETGIASMSFSAGAIILAVDAPVRLASGVEIDSSVVVASADASTRVRHTSPGSKAGDEDRKARVALGRMRVGIREALTSGDRLADQWERALASFPAGFDTKQMGDNAWDVLLDLAEERIGFEGSDRADLLKIVSTDARLKTLPHGSAAHMAAAFALLGKFATTADEAVRLQAIAGTWLLRCWA